MNARQIIEAIVDSELAALREATVRRPPRSRQYVAVFTGPEPGQQIARSTGLTDPTAALALAKEWQTQARRKREARKAERGDAPTPRFRSLGLTQREVAAIMRLSERGVRAVEKRAIAKLKRHPLLNAIWSEYNESRALTGLRAKLQSWQLSLEDERALLGLARSPLELQVLRRVLAFCHPTPRQT